MSQRIIAEISRLQTLTVGELRVEWERLYGEPTRSRNRQYLWRRLAWRVQELQLGGLSAAANECMLALAPAASVLFRTPPAFHAKAAFPTPPGSRRSRRDPRLPRPGSRLVRRYKGADVRVLVLDDGFEYDGRHFDSLSEVAYAVTGSHWSGPLFFGLRKRKRSR